MRNPASAVLVGFALAVSACSADSVTAPEPLIEQPGSFVVATDVEGLIFLVRTLRVVPFAGGDSFYEVILYSVSPASYAEAKRLAQQPSLPIAAPHASFSLRAFKMLDSEVVWFRTLEPSELAALR